jgi:hypothetical protein
MMAKQRFSDPDEQVIGELRDKMPLAPAVRPNKALEEGDSFHSITDDHYHDNTDEEQREADLLEKLTQFEDDKEDKKKASLVTDTRVLNDITNRLLKSLLL